MHFPPRPSALSLNCLAGLSLLGTGLACAQPDAAAPRPNVIQVLGSDEDAARVAAPFSLLDDAEIFARGAATLGNTLSHLPGVRADTFGAGASRPVIRGQVSPRVEVLSDGVSLLDASEISPDHVVTTEPLLLRRVEVLRGPATLLYGSGAVGGVVNLLDDRIPTRLPDTAEGFVALRGNSVAEERAAAASLSLKAREHLGLHLEGSTREASDYRVPDWREERVAGSHRESSSASAGAGWVGERGYLGLAYSYREDDYGLPGHSHEYEGCHPHGSALHCGSHEAGGDGHDHEHSHEQGQQQAPSIALDSRRLDLRGEYREPFAGVHRLRLRLAHSDYEHDEIEAGVVGTTFRNKGQEGRVELDHAPWLGWHGIAGLQFSSTNFSALGAEAFLPEVDSRMLGLFTVQHRDLSDTWHLEAGLRYERQEHAPVNDARQRPRFEDSALSYSLAAVWEFLPDQVLAISHAHAERLPHAQELYARGIHLATNTYECGLLPHSLTCGGAENNVALALESSSNLEISLRGRQGGFSYDLNLFSNRADNYSHARTLDSFEDFRLIKYSQSDAEFRGAEIELSYHFSERLSTTLFADSVRARFAEGGNLPRVPPLRAGLRLNLGFAGGSATIEYSHVARQEDVAEHEASTPGYQLLDLTLDFKPFGDARQTLFLRGDNLLDEQIWNHSSFLARTIPLPGRNLSLGFRQEF